MNRDADALRRLVLKPYAPVLGTDDSSSAASSLAGRRIVGSRRTTDESISGPCPAWDPPLPRYVVGPCLHDRAPLLEQVVARVGGDGRGALHVRQRELREQLVHVVLPRPVLEARPRAKKSLQLSDTKYIISFGTKPFPTNLPTWTDW